MCVCVLVEIGKGGGGGGSRGGGVFETWQFIKGRATALFTTHTPVDRSSADKRTSLLGR